MPGVHQGVKLSTGRLCHALLHDSSLRFLVEQSMLPSVPGAAYP